MGDMFKLYTIRSDKSLEDILKIISKFSQTDKKEIGPIKRKFMRDVETGKYIKTNESYILMCESVFLKIKEDTLTGKNNFDMSISEYKIRNENKPPHNSVYHFYFPYSKENCVEMTKRLNYIETLGLLPKNSYEIYSDIVYFKKNIDVTILTMIKIILDDKDCRVSWCRKNIFYGSMKSNNSNTSTPSTPSKANKTAKNRSK